MRSWDREFEFTDEQKASIRELLPKNAINPDKFLWSVELWAQVYRGHVWYFVESTRELKPNQFRPILLRIGKKAANLRDELDRLGGLSGRGLIDTYLYRFGCNKKTEDFIEELLLLSEAAAAAFEKSADMKPYSPERIMMRSIKREYTISVGRLGRSRNCRCYKIIGLVLKFAGRSMDDWYHLYTDS